MFGAFNYRITVFEFLEERELLLSFLSLKLLQLFPESFNVQNFNRAVFVKLFSWDLVSSLELFDPMVQVPYPFSIFTSLYSLQTLHFSSKKLLSVDKGLLRNFRNEIIKVSIRFFYWVCLELLQNLSFFLPIDYFFFSSLWHIKLNEVVLKIRIHQ